MNLRYMRGKVYRKWFDFNSLFEHPPCPPPSLPSVVRVIDFDIVIKS